MPRRYNKKRNYRRNKKRQYRNNIARQIQPAHPRPLRSQLVRMCWTNACYLKPSIVGNTQPCLGFRIAVNRPHKLLDTPSFTSGLEPQEKWVIPLTGDGMMPHLSQWRAKYQSYLVRGCKITCTFRTEGGSTTADRSGKIFLCRHGGDNDINEGTTYQSLRDNNQMVNMANVTPSTATTNQVRLNMGYSPARFFAVNKSALNADDTIKGHLSGTTDVGPIEDAFISLGYISPFTNSTTGEFTMPEGLLEIKIEQLVEFSNPYQNTAQQPNLLTY